MILTALGVVKVATAAQLRRLMAPRHATNQTILNGAKDLAAHGLVVSLGSAKSVNANGNRVTEKLWNLTPAGLEAAGVVLEREVRDMGSTAKASVASRFLFGASGRVAIRGALGRITPTSRRRTASAARPGARSAPGVR